MAYQCDRCSGWTADSQMHDCIYDYYEAIEAKLKIATEALEKIKKQGPLSMQEDWPQNVCADALWEMDQIQGGNK